MLTNRVRYVNRSFVESQRKQYTNNVSLSLVSSLISTANSVTTVTEFIPPFKGETHKAGLIDTCYRGKNGLMSHRVPRGRWPLFVLQSREREKINGAFYCCLESRHSMNTKEVLGRTARHIAWREGGQEVSGIWRGSIDFEKQRG